MSRPLIVLGGVLLVTVVGAAGLYLGAGSTAPSSPPPQSPAATSPAPSQVAAAPSSAVGPAPAPAVVGPAPAPESPEEAQERQRWERRLVDEDERVVQQVIKAGCDPERAALLRGIFAAQRHSRARTAEDFRAGRIDGDALASQTVAAQAKTDEAMAALLRESELAAIDRLAARAAIVEQDLETAPPATQPQDPDTKRPRK